MGTIWRWLQKLAGILLVVLLCLYILRCVVTAKFIDADHFAHYVLTLIRTLTN